MAGGLKEIKSRIRTAKNTNKITYAMKLVSAAKLKKAQDAVSSSREYTDALDEMLATLLATLDTSKLSHPLLTPREKITRKLFIVVGASRGLCGAYNAGISKACDKILRENPEESVTMIVLGKKPSEHIRKHALESGVYTEQALNLYEDLPDDPNEWPLADVTRFAIEWFLAGREDNRANAPLEHVVDEVYLVYTKFHSAISMEVCSKKILPLKLQVDETSGYAPKTIFEPSAESVFEALIPRLVRAQIQQSCLDAKASEHASRMTAMDAATKNAKDLIEKLTLTHNKLRQAAITADILDIVGGAEAT